MENKIIIIFIIIFILTISSINSQAKSVIKFQYDNINNFSIDELYTNFKIDKHKLSIGKKHLKLNPGKINQLIINQNGPSVPLIYLEDDLKYFDVQQAVLFITEDKKRRLFLRRLSFDKIIKNFEIGFTEAIMASEYINFFYYFPYPYVPAYLYKKLSGLNNIYDQHDDVYAGIDLNYKYRKIELYAELMVDEYPSHPGAANPNKRGHLIGFKLPFHNNYYINLEYSNVFAGVYEHRYEENDYTYLEENIGHTFGADVVEYDLRIGYKNDNINYNLTYSNIKKGPNIGEDGILLREVIEKINIISFNHEYYKDNRSYQLNFKNYNYQSESENNRFILEIALMLNF